MGRFVSALPLSELAPGTMVGLDIEGKRILVSNLEGKVYAVSAICTHEDTDLSAGFLIEERVVCPLHLSQFDLRDGKVYNPPAEVPLQTYNVKIEEGQIFVEV
jgi:nitrite reductase/ring-hydroxylating ferredoxin subunit